MPPLLRRFRSRLCNSGQMLACTHSSTLIYSLRRLERNTTFERLLSEQIVLDLHNLPSNEIKAAAVVGTGRLGSS